VAAELEGNLRKTFGSNFHMFLRIRVWLEGNLKETVYAWVMDGPPIVPAGLEAIYSF
jgi:hypothetical protein